MITIDTDWFADSTAFAVKHHDELATDIANKFLTGTEVSNNTIALHLEAKGQMEAWKTLTRVIKNAEGDALAAATAFCIEELFKKVPSVVRMGIHSTTKDVDKLVDDAQAEVFKGVYRTLSGTAATFAF
jgi:hypothetical protein